MNTLRKLGLWIFSACSEAAFGLLIHLGLVRFAVAQYEVGDPGVNEVYGQDTYTQAVNATTIFNPKFGLWGPPKSGKPFVLHNDFSVKSGRRITCRLLGPHISDGYTGDADMTGLETGLGLEEYDWEISTVKNRPLGIADEEDQQAVSWDLVDSYKDAHAEWGARILEAGAHMHMAGATFQDDVDYYRPNGAKIRANIQGLPGVHPHTYSWNNATTVPSSGRLLIASEQANAQALTSSHTFSVADLNRMVDTAQTTNPPMLPCLVFGTRAWLVFVHTNAWSSFVEQSGHYDAINQATLQGGLDPKKSIYQTGNLTPWRNCIFIQSIWNPPAQNSSTAVALANTRVAYLVGQNALVCGYGKGHKKARMKWREDRYNVTSAYRCQVSMLYGGRKVTWTDPDDNSTRDNAVVALAHYAANTGDA